MTDVRLGMKPAVKVGLAIAGAAALGLGAYIIFMLATEDRVGKACAHLEGLGEPLVVESLVQYVQRNIVGLGIEREEHVRIEEDGTHPRCMKAFETIEHAYGNRQFERLVKCAEGAPTPNAARECFR